MAFFECDVRVKNLARNHQGMIVTFDANAVVTVESESLTLARQAVQSHIKGDPSYREHPKQIDQGFRASYELGSIRKIEAEDDVALGSIIDWISLPRD